MGSPLHQLDQRKPTGRQATQLADGGNTMGWACLLTGQKAPTFCRRCRNAAGASEQNMLQMQKCSRCFRTRQPMLQPQPCLPHQKQGLSDTELHLHLALLHTCSTSILYYEHGRIIHGPLCVETGIIHSRLCFSQPCS